MVLHAGDALDVYEAWPAPQAIVSDGAYGVGGFTGDPPSVDGLAAWYKPHVSAWARHAKPGAALWFWNTELGWATVHPLLADHGWEYVQTVVWDKGISHVAGNVNSATIRHLPVVTEVCAFYRRRMEFGTDEGPMTAQQWLKHEWQRTGLPLRCADDACGVSNAASRKYLTHDSAWYAPSGEMFRLLADYANTHGDPSGRPYFSYGNGVPSADQWDRMRGVWHHAHGITNVWSSPPLHNAERLKGLNGAASHPNQKPLALMRLIINSCTEYGDVVWEPFGGLCSASVAAVEAQRVAYAAEIDPECSNMAARRLDGVAPLLPL